MINGLWAKDGNEMSTAKDGINMDYSRIVRGSLDNPHPSVNVQRVSSTIIPINQSTWVFNVIKSQQEQESDMANIKAQHALKFVVGTNQDGVIT